MNNFKKIGLSALAGSLAAMSVNAVEMSVSGGAAFYVGSSDENGRGYYSMGDSVTFSASGTTDGGLDISVSMELDGNDKPSGTSVAMDDRSMSVGSATLGTITFHQHGGTSVVGGWDDLTPNAYEESWDMTIGADTEVIGGRSGDKILKYESPTFQGVTFSAAYQDRSDTENTGTYNDFGFKIVPEMVDGLELGYATGSYNDTATTEIDESTMYIKYAYGPITVGYQESEKDGSTTAKSDESEAYGITYAITDDFSIGYNKHELDVDLSSAGNVQESTGISASYTMGGMTISGAMNETDNVGGSSDATNDKESYELGLSFAF